MVLKENLKIGDKVRGVRSHTHSLSSFVGRDCTVIEIMPEDSSFVCRVSGCPWGTLLVYSWEIEKICAYVPNEQLLFSFME